MDALQTTREAGNRLNAECGFLMRGIVPLRHAARRTFRVTDVESAVQFIEELP
jgi:hypothetical protein